MEEPDLIKYLLNIATKGETDYEDKEIRLRIGYLASIVGLIINILLTVIKLTIGFMISSISVIADGFNNLADSASSIVTLVGFKLSSLPPDKEHPYGHARIEYISALIVAFMVIMVGFQFVKASFDRIINPQIVKFEMIPFIILILSISFKIWLSIFNKKLDKKINSTSLRAIATDAMGDVLTTSIVVLSLVLGRFTSFPVDGFIGLIVAVIIILSGYNLVKETISPLIGEAPPKELINAIYHDISTYDYITGAHDLVIHSYGVGKTMATIDVEFPSNIDVITIHNVIDKAEREIGEKHNLTLVIHMDPLGPESKEHYELRNEIKHILKENDKIKSMHDFQVLEAGTNDIIVEFHLVVDGNKMTKDETEEDLRDEMRQLIEERCESVKCIIVIDTEY